jgi:hypothetical protein
MGWSCRSDKYRNECRILVGKPLGRPWRKLEDNIKINISEIVYEVGGGCNWLRITSSSRWYWIFDPQLTYLLTYLLTSPLRSLWNTGPQQLSVAEVSVAFTFCYRDRVASPVLQPPTWRTRSPYLYPLEAEWPSYIPSHRVSILVASYDTHELRWDPQLQEG